MGELWRSASSVSLNLNPKMGSFSGSILLFLDDFISCMLREIPDLMVFYLHTGRNKAMNL